MHHHPPTDLALAHATRLRRYLHQLALRNTAGHPPTIGQRNHALNEAELLAETIRRFETLSPDKDAASSRGKKPR